MPTFPRGHTSQTLNAKNAGLIHKLSGHVQTTPSRITWQVDPSDWETLRGIPALGKGVSGAIRGTRPDRI